MLLRSSTSTIKLYRSAVHSHIQGRFYIYTLAPGTPLTSLRTDRVRVVAFIKRKDEVSREQFSRYWREEYAERFTAIPIVRKNLLKYEQVSDLSIMIFKDDDSDVCRDTPTLSSAKLWNGWNSSQLRSGMDSPCSKRRTTQRYLRSV